MIAMVFSKERALGLSVQYKYVSHNSFLLSREINVEGQYKQSIHFILLDINLH